MLSSVIEDLERKLLKSQEAEANLKNKYEAAKQENELLSSTVDKLEDEAGNLKAKLRRVLLSNQFQVRIARVIYR